MYFMLLLYLFPENNGSIGASYKLETTFLVVSPNSYFYTLLENVELLRSVTTPYDK